MGKGRCLASTADPDRQTAGRWWPSELTVPQRRRMSGETGWPPIRYDERYTYAFRIDSGRASSEANQYAKDFGATARSVSEVRQPERAHHRPIGIVSDSLLPM